MRTVGIVGLGYVGLPLAVHFADRGFRVIAFDTDDAKVVSLKECRSYIEDVTDDQLKSVVTRICPTTDPSLLSTADCVSVCVPTPVKGILPDLEPIMGALESIADHVKPGAVVVIESTVYPNFTKEKAAPLFPNSEVVFSPERVDPCNTKYSIKDIPKVLGADSPSALEKARHFYSEVFTLHEVHSTSVAEVSKLLENTYRAVNIALINEVRDICADLEINVWDVIEAADSKPFGFQAFKPSLGVGGHCIPVDPYYLLSKGNSSFIQSAMDINRHSVMRCLNIVRDKLKGNVLLLGMAYKPNVSDCRESPSLHLLRDLQTIEESGQFAIGFFDPYVAQVNSDKGLLNGFSSLKEALEWADCALVCVNHDVFDKSMILESGALVFDFCGMFRGKYGISGL